MKKELNKWQFIYGFSPDYKTMESGWKVFRIGVVKFLSFPEQGEMFSKQHHKGYILQFKVWLPIDKIEVY